MNLIIETDIGHDPDDFFALCYLASVGVNIRAIMICPGDPDQVAIARLFCKEVGLDIPIGASKLDRNKLSSGSVHHDLLKKYDHSLYAKPDGLGIDLLPEVFKSHSDSELFVIGPVTSLGKYLKNSDLSISRATMQGGFCGYHLHCPRVRLEQFEGKTWVPTFNLNGDRDGALSFLAANIKDRRFVGKNVCHTVVYTKDQYSNMTQPRCRAAELFMEGMGLYLERHDGKKFHDPTAAVCHLHPEIGFWLTGAVKKIESGWGTVCEGTDKVLADIDYDKLWEHIYNWS
jgi:pyrimidine-specific ribonucleoside hydrolase